MKIKRITEHKISTVYTQLCTIEGGVTRLEWNKKKVYPENSYTGIKIEITNFGVAFRLF